jgi:RES domain
VGADFGALCSQSVAYQDDLVRNIKSIRVSQNLYDDLARTPEEAGVAIAAEGRLRVPSAQPAVTRPFDYGTVISYSFDSSHWQETRFSAGRHYGVWYGATDVRTTVYETVFHWHRFLLDSFPDLQAEVIGERRLFNVRCDALLVDLRGCTREAPQLVSRTSYAFTQELGRYLVEQQQNGLLFPSSRCEGVNAAVFNAARLSNVRDRLYLTYRYSPSSRRVKVERTPGRTWISITPTDLY